MEASHGEVLSCSHKGGNRKEPFTVAVQKSRATVIHVPRRISCVCLLFLQQGDDGISHHRGDLTPHYTGVPCVLIHSSHFCTIDVTSLNMDDIHYAIQVLGKTQKLRSIWSNRTDTHTHTHTHIHTHTHTHTHTHAHTHAHTHSPPHTHMHH